jgi:hypothetical protein
MTVCPLTTIFAVRDEGPVFACTRNVSVESEAPDGADVNWIHDALAVACQAQFAETVRRPDPPVAAIVMGVESILTLQFAGACTTSKTLPPTMMLARLVCSPVFAITA